MSEDKKTVKAASAPRDQQPDASKAAPGGATTPAEPVEPACGGTAYGPYYPYSAASMVDAGAAHSMAQLFEGMVQAQLYGNNILAATTARCVNHILEGGARQRAETLEQLIREER